jgi:hypothetical protein
MQKISFIHLTYRQGGYDILADSLVNQRFQDYELIIIDDFTPDRSTVVRSYLENKGIHVKYIGPSKPKAFPEASFGIFNAANTGFIKAACGIAIVATDYQWFAPDCFDKIMLHDDKLKNRTCVVLPARTWDCFTLRNNSGLISVWENEWKGNPTLNNCVEKAPWIPEGMEFAMTAYPMDVIEDMNGFPEYMDTVSSQPYEPIMEKFNSVGAKAYVDTNNFMFALNHREWEPAELWYQSARKPVTGVTSLIKRDNPFNLKYLRRK